MEELPANVGVMRTCNVGTAKSFDIAVGKACIKLGRGPGNDVRLANVRTSNFHCALHISGGSESESGFTVELEDTSSNGTFVNGEKVGRGNRRTLASGDEITLLRHQQVGESDSIAFTYIETAAAQKRESSQPQPAEKAPKIDTKL
ncbi:MAG: FHA domain-containing protein [Kangiellaceae bacterium]|jgi:serine/threonine/tyrosine protein kinase RAD53|nr:FHA domain-containing protein [Kangiellaceae bacterium]